MKNSFHSYNTAYADALNQQMLLNLARLDNGHPAYYLVIGAINNRFTFGSQTSAGNTGNFTDNSTTTENQQSQGGVLSTVGRTFSKAASTVFGYSLNQSVTRTSNPEFQFIPLNNEAVAKQVLEPISAEVFYALYLQGHPIDQLLRVLIERIETTLPNNEELVLVNSPSTGTEESFGRFLRACAILRELQRLGYLDLEARSHFDLIGPLPGERRAGQSPREGSGSEGGYSPTLKDFSDAQDKGLTLLNTNGGWSLGRKQPMPKFVLRREQAGKAIAHVSETHPTSYAQAVSNVVELLSEGITVQTGPDRGGQAKTRLILRSFDRVMQAVAREQTAFDLLAARTNSPALFRDLVPAMELRPILRTVWPEHGGRLTAPLQTIRYAGKTYQIADPVASPLDPTEAWNRNVFRLLIALSSQVTVDISKFQRQVLELR